MCCTPTYLCVVATLTCAFGLLSIAPVLLNNLNHGQNHNNGCYVVSVQRPRDQISLKPLVDELRLVRYEREQIMTLQHNLKGLIADWQELIRKMELKDNLKNDCLVRQMKHVSNEMVHLNKIDTQVLTGSSSCSSTCHSIPKSGVVLAKVEGIVASLASYSTSLFILTCVLVFIRFVHIQAYRR